MNSEQETPIFACNLFEMLVCKFLFRVFLSEIKMMNGGMKVMMNTPQSRKIIMNTPQSGKIMMNTLQSRKIMMNTLQS